MQRTFKLLPRYILINRPCLKTNTVGISLSTGLGLAWERLKDGRLARIGNSIGDSHLRGWFIVHRQIPHLSIKLKSVSFHHLPRSVWALRDSCSQCWQTLTLQVLNKSISPDNTTTGVHCNISYRGNKIVWKPSQVDLKRNKTHTACRLEWTLKIVILICFFVI